MATSCCAFPRAVINIGNSCGSGIVETSSITSFKPVKSAVISRNVSLFSSRDRSISRNQSTSRISVATSTELKVLDEEEDIPDESPTAAVADDDHFVPSAFEIQSLLMELCDETSIAELQLKVGSFDLHVKRDIGAKKSKSNNIVAKAAPPVPTKPMMDSIAAPATPSSSTPPSPPAYDSDEEGIEEGLLYVTSPKVGVFRRGRFYKGKRGKPLVTEDSQVKIGQVVCYLEQLGTQLAVESEHAGEVVGILAEDGDPVGFSELLIAIRPSFPGIKKLQ